MKNHEDDGIIWQIALRPSFLARAGSISSGQSLIKAGNAMEDIEKYIFDPKHPQKCRVYNLLLNIVKKENNAAFISPHFFYGIFENEFQFVNDLWDLPENFDDLCIIEKVRTYIGQYSLLEFKQKIIKSIQPKFADNITNELFRNFIDFSFKNKNPFQNIAFELLLKPFEHPSGASYFGNPDRNKIIGYNYSLVCFLDPKTFGFLDFVKFNASSVVVTESDNFDEKIFHAIRRGGNAHPLLLKNTKDIRMLLDVLSRDVHNRASQSPQTGKNIAYLEKISIKKYFCVEDLEVEGLEDKREIYVVGENGDGKTLFLQAIVLTLKGDEEIGVVTDFIKPEKSNIKMNAVDSKEKEYVFEPTKSNAFNNIYAYGVNRGRDDSDKKEEYGYLTLFDMSQYLKNPIKWLQYLDYKERSGETDQISLEVAKEMLKDILDENIEIEVSPEQVIFNERGTKVAFDHLSDGYKSVVIWVCDLVERLSKNQPHVNQLRDFKGIVLVDEIDLHLHPKWQYRIVRKLRGWFPNIQFIITTHSPTVILGSSKDAVFYKLYKEDGIVKISEPLRNIKNQMANTILTSPLFGLGQASAINSDDDVDTSQDYYYSIIHKEIAKRVKADKGITEEKILKMVLDELDKTEAEQKGNDKDRKGFEQDTGIAKLGEDESAKK